MRLRHTLLTGRTAVLTTAVLCALALGACATNRPAGDQVDDAAITAKVKAKLAADPELNPFKINVDTTDARSGFDETSRIAAPSIASRAR